MNILSIDFDIIMYPYIKLYNDKVNGGENPTKVWDFLSLYNIEEYIAYDAITYKKIVQLLCKVKQNNGKIIFIENHEEVISHLKLYENYSDMTFNLTNIDFHHDVFYNTDDIAISKYFEKYSCANWVGHLAVNNKLDSLLWVKAPNSESDFLSSFNIEEFCNFNIESINSVEQSFMNKKYDYIFICLSPQWVPYKLHHLYDICRIIAEEE